MTRVRTCSDRIYEFKQPATEVIRLCRTHKFIIDCVGCAIATAHIEAIWSFNEG